MTTIDPPDRRWYEDIRALYELSAALARAEDADQVCERALQGVRRTLRADRAAVLLLDGAGVMRFRAWQGLSDAYRAAVEGHSPWPIDVRNAAPVVVPDVAADPALAPLSDVLRREGIRAVAFIPISYGERLLGKYMLYFDEPRQLTREELDVARAVADNIAVAVDRRTVEQELRESRDQLGAILSAVSD